MGQSAAEINHAKQRPVTPAKFAFGYQPRLQWRLTILVESLLLLTLFLTSVFLYFFVPVVNWKIWLLFSSGLLLGGVMAMGVIGRLLRQAAARPSGKSQADERAEAIGIKVVRQEHTEPSSLPPLTEHEQTETLMSLQQAKDELEKALEARTLELRLANKRLQIELAEHEQTEAELIQRDHEFTVLQSASITITSSLDLRYVLDTVSQEMVKLLNVESCTIFAWNEMENTISEIAKYDSKGWWDPELLIRIRRLAEYPVTGGVLSEQIPEQMTISQAYLDPAELAYMQKSNIKSRMMLPMIFRKRVVGLVELEDSRVERAFTYQEISLVKLLANQAGSAIENARLYLEIQQHVDELTILNEISHAMTSTLDLQEMLTIINERISQLLGVAANSVALYDEATHDLWFVAASGDGAEFVRDQRLALGQLSLRGRPDFG